MPLVFVGTYTQRGSEGIYAFRFDPETGALRATGHTAWVENPSYLALHPEGRLLYATNEVAQFAGQHCGHNPLPGGKK